MPRLLTSSALLAIAVLLSLGPPAWSQKEAPPGGGDLLRIGYSSRLFYDVDANDALVATREWVRNLIRESGGKGESETFIFPDQPAIVKAVNTAKVELVVLLPEEFVLIRDQAPDLEPMGTCVNRERLGYRYGLLVRKDGGITRLPQLKRLKPRRLALDTGDKGSLPRMWMDILLKKEGMPEAGAFFDEIREFRKTSQAVLSVFFGQADACIASLETFETMADLNPQLGREIQVLASSREVVRDLICVRKSFRSDYRKRVEDVIYTFDSRPNGRQFLSMFHVDRIVPYDPAHIQGVLDLFRDYEALTKRGGRR